MCVCTHTTNELETSQKQSREHSEAASFQEFPGTLPCLYISHNYIIILSSMFRPLHISVD